MKEILFGITLFLQVALGNRTMHTTDVFDMEIGKYRSVSVESFHSFGFTLCKKNIGSYQKVSSDCEKCQDGKKQYFCKVCNSLFHEKEYAINFHKDYKKWINGKYEPWKITVFLF